MEAFLVAVPVGGIAVSVVCGLKGKWWCVVAAVVSAVVVPGSVVAALVASDPHLTPYQLVWLVGGAMMVAVVVGSARLAKPDSRWARWWYGDRKMLRARRRFDGRASVESRS